MNVGIALGTHYVMKIIVTDKIILHFQHTLCRHFHRNKDCFKQNPEIAVGPRAKKWIEKGKQLKGKGKAVLEDEDETEDETPDGGTCLSAAMIENESPYIYDTGASHHFVSQKKFFSDLNSCPRPFRFDQAIGTVSIQQQGKAQLKFGNVTLQLNNAL